MKLDDMNFVTGMLFQLWQILEHLIDALRPIGDDDENFTFETLNICVLREVNKM